MPANGTDSRKVTYARLSLTERCNLACSYCRSGHQAPDAGVLSLEHVAFLVRAAALAGVTRLRLTGGEPLLHPDIERVVATCRAQEGIEQVALTTNGLRLAPLSRGLADAGLARVNVSLDSLRPERFAAVTGSDALGRVLAGLDAALAAGLSPVKVNMVVMRSVNLDEVEDFARLSVERDLHVRFIEVMPLGNPGFYRPDLLVPAAEVRGRVAALGALEPACVDGSGPARVWRLAGARGTVGFIGAMTECFCGTCNRIRVTSRLAVHPCLASEQHVSLAGAVLSGDVEAAAQAIRDSLSGKGLQHGMSPAGLACPGRISAIGG